jgi:hypothetical protein
VICSTLKRATGLLCLVILFAANIEAARQVRADIVPEETEAPSSSRNDRSSRSESITRRFLSGLRSPIGFSIGLQEVYAPNSQDSPLGDKVASFTILQPRLFANAKTRKAQFQFDYAFGYRSNNRQREIRSTDHSATLEVGYTLSRNASLQISNTFRSTINDYGALPNVAAPTMYQAGFAQELYLPRERATTNSLVTSLSYRAGKMTNVNVFTGYNMWRYGADSAGNSQGFQVGIRGDHQINKWFFLNSSYSHYLNAVDPKFQAASIHRLQVGGLKFKLRRNMEFYLSGGMDYTRGQPAASYQAGLSKTSASTQISVVYHRGLSTAVGRQDALNGHVVSASLSQWVSRRMNIQLNTGYTRGASLSRTSSLDYLSGSAEVQIAVHSHGMLSVQSSYISQRGTNLPPEAPVLSRYVVSTGYTFFFSSLDGRRRAGGN